ncbi:uncharacterized protein JN550_007070 [Neoarthrinium moseri]|uniref:uncharacterized protein n=1 Tax=Neoarthrinium moseri TaxID=1658444 RepID=UPI001FDC04A9|nr:uncharacterized protein JN550_007070 [Neoarthrinium moseri]KAI1867339.1 hypothetical protein JN550_007070 [Neoarthrinium moseri]
MAHTKSGQSDDQDDSYRKPNGRKGSKKVRTGCLTCKLRKVKCDETKPECLRCKRTGRVCNGYQAARPGKRARQGPPADDLRLSVALNAMPEFGSAVEAQSYHFFLTHSGPSLASDYDSGFWNSLVLQLCHSERAVLHAVLAVSSFHESLLLGNLDGQGELEDRQVFALEQYNIAIGILRDQMNEETVRDAIVPLLMCLLFICMEYMQGKEVDALNYINQGRQIIQKFSQIGHVPGYQVDIIKQHIVPLYIRSGVTAVLSGASVQPIPDRFDAFYEVPPLFSTIQDARHTFYSMMDRVLRFTSDARLKVQDADLPPASVHDLRAHQQWHLSSLSKWNTAYAVLTATQSVGDPPPLSMILLQIYYHAAIIWVSTALTLEETDYDQYLDHFSAILPLARRFFDFPPSHGSQPRPKHSSNRTPENPDESRRATSSHVQLSTSRRDFSFDTQIIPPLYFVAVKCRHPIIRRTALNLLMTCNDRQENLWRSGGVGAVAARLVEVETEIAEQAKCQSPGGPDYESHGKMQYISIRSTGTQKLRPVSQSGRLHTPVSTAPNDIEIDSALASTVGSQGDATTAAYDFRNVAQGKAYAWDSYDQIAQHLQPGSMFGLPTHWNSGSFDDLLPGLEPISRSDGSMSYQSESSSPASGATRNTIQNSQGLAAINLNESLLPPLSSTSPWVDDTATMGAISSSGSFASPCMEPPYGLPEGSRITDAIIDYPGSYGIWATFFQKPQNDMEEARVWNEFIPISRTPRTDVTNT